MNSLPQTVDSVIERAVVLDAQRQAALRFDLVTQTHSYETIARRYGLDGESGLAKYLVDNPGFRADVAKLRALFTSDMSAQERCRIKAAIASEELVPDIFNLVSDSKLPASTRIDGFKQLNRMAGVDGVATGSKEGAGNAGTQFNLTINLPDRTETITTVVETPAPGEEA